MSSPALPHQLSSSDSILGTSIFYFYLIYGIADYLMSFLFWFNFFFSSSVSLINKRDNWYLRCPLSSTRSFLFKGIYIYMNTKSPVWAKKGGFTFSLVLCILPFHQNHITYTGRCFCKTQFPFIDSLILSKKVFTQVHLHSFKFILFYLWEMLVYIICMDYTRLKP